MDETYNLTEQFVCALYGHKIRSSTIWSEESLSVINYHFVDHSYENIQRGNNQKVYYEIQNYVGW